MEQMPAASALTSMSPEIRVSRPIKKRPEACFLGIEIGSDGPSRLKRCFAIQRILVGYATDAVGSKKFTQ